MTAHQPALLLKLYHYAGLGIARSLGRLGVPVHAIHEDARAPAARSRHLREVVEWDLDRRPDEATLELVLDVGRRIGGRPVLFATDDAGLGFVTRNAEALQERFSFPRPPPGLTERLLSKRGLRELCLEHGVPSPGAAFPESRDEAREALERATYPVLLKAIDNVRFAARNGLRMVIARDAREALAAYDRLEDPVAPNLMIQDYLPGDSSTVWVWTGYFDRDSELLFGAGGTKLRQYPVDTGTTCFGDVRPDPALEAMLRRFVKAIGYRGVFDCGLRFDTRDGRHKLLDVNPRVGANFRQCVGRGGLDVARAMYLDLTGRPVPADVPDERHVWWVENYDAAGAVHLHRDGRLPLHRWAASLRRVTEPAWFDARDPRPFAAMLGAATATARGRLRRPSASEPVLEHALDGRVEGVEPV